MNTSLRSIKRLLIILGFVFTATILSNTALFAEDLPPIEKSAYSIFDEETPDWKKKDLWKNIKKEFVEVRTSFSKSSGKKPDTNLVKKLISDLGSVNYETREKAYSQLKKMGSSIRTILSQTYKQTKDAEIKMSLEELLNLSQNTNFVDAIVNICNPSRIGGLFGSRRSEWGATGFVISPKGHVLTNAHVVEYMTLTAQIDPDMFIVFYKEKNGQPYYAKGARLLMRDKHLDVALLQFDVSKPLKPFDKKLPLKKAIDLPFLKLAINSNLADLKGKQLLMGGHPVIRYRKNGLLYYRNDKLFTTGGFLKANREGTCDRCSDKKLTLQYATSSLFSLGGFSGSPVMDKKGVVYGLHSSGSEEKGRLSNFVPISLIGKKLRLKDYVSGRIEREFKKIRSKIDNHSDNNDLILKELKKYRYLHSTFMFDLASHIILGNFSKNVKEALIKLIMKITHHPSADASGVTFRMKIGRDYNIIILPDNSDSDQTEILKMRIRQESSQWKKQYKDSNNHNEPQKVVVELKKIIENGSRLPGQDPSFPNDPKKAKAALNWLKGLIGNNVIDFERRKQWRDFRNFETRQLDSTRAYKENEKDERTHYEIEISYKRKGVVKTKIIKFNKDPIEKYGGDFTSNYYSIVRVQLD